MPQVTLEYSPDGRSWCFWARYPIDSPDLANATQHLARQGQYVRLHHGAAEPGSVCPHCGGSVPAQQGGGQ